MDSTMVFVVIVIIFIVMVILFGLRFLFKYLKPNRYELTNEPQVEYQIKPKQVVYVVLALIIVMILINSIPQNKVTSNKPNVTIPETSEDKSNLSNYSNEKDLASEVYFNGTQFVVVNKENFDWTDVNIKINDDYYINFNKIRSGDKVTIGAMQFADDKGTRFDPFKLKPRELVLTCRTPNGFGIKMGNWN